MTHPNRRKVLQFGMAAATAGGLLPLTVAAQNIPDSARILVGFPAGSSLDVISRLIAERLTGKLAKAVVVDNRPGAGGRIAAEVSLQAPPDGTTLLFNPGGLLVINPHIFKKMSFDPFKDFVPLTLTATFNFAFGVGPAVPADVKNLEQFAAWIKANPSKAAYGSPAPGSPTHFVGHAINSALGLNMTHIGYKGGGPAMNDLMGGQLAALVMTEGDYLTHARTGRVRVLAVSGKGRSRFFPDVPNLTEQKIPGLEDREWYGMYIGGKPSAAVVNRVGGLVREVTQSREYVLTLNNMGFEAASSTPQELDRLAREGLKKWEPLVKATGFQGD